MARNVNVGGDRLGSGNKLKVSLHGFERSNHDLSYIWRSTMAPGTLVPFLSVPILPGDTFDIDLNTMVLTHPTIGPLFGSFKVQLDLFQIPVRLYIGILQQNATKIGMKMSDIKMPIMTMSALYDRLSTSDFDNSQINPSSIFKYLGISGIGRTASGGYGTVTRSYNAIPLLGYWDIYKQYYANKQEELGYVVHYEPKALINTVSTIQHIQGGTTTTINVSPSTAPSGQVQITRSSQIKINYTGTTPREDQIVFLTNQGEKQPLEIFGSSVNAGSFISLTNPIINTSNLYIINWRYINPNDTIDREPQLSDFPLSEIDDMRHSLITHEGIGTAYDIGATEFRPYSLAFKNVGGFYSKMNALEGLGVKTYQSDIYNNWLNEEWIDGTGGVNEISAVSTVGDSFTIDALNLANKVYNLFNRIAISDGTYQSYIEAAYDHDLYGLCQFPVYEGGLSKELEFQEVISNAAAPTENGGQPLGTLAGRGQLGPKHKGGRATIKANEIGWVMGIISLTPRIDYSQGNTWDINLKSIADFHVPNLDGIGFQDLLEEQIHWCGTEIDGATVTTDAIGKTPAWINYMTAVNRTFGNFAIKGNEMFMTLNRNYETYDGVTDVTTYIDPVKYNQIFAYTKRDAQNFWVQIRIGINARRKMSAKIMPNL